MRLPLSTADGHSHPLNLTPKLITNDLRVQVEAAADGVGIALLPEPIASATLRNGELIHLLPEWSGSRHTIYLVYPRLHGMLPSARSLITTW